MNSALSRYAVRLTPAFLMSADITSHATTRNGQITLLYWRTEFRKDAILKLHY